MNAYTSDKEQGSGMRSGPTENPKPLKPKTLHLKFVSAHCSIAAHRTTTPPPTPLVSISSGEAWGAGADQECEGHGGDGGAASGRPLGQPRGWRRVR